MNKIAIIYQADLPPVKNGIRKPMKVGGYSDSGADIAFELLNNKLPLVTCNPIPRTKVDLDWVFPDHKEGIQLALQMGARILWLNTVLYEGHSIEHFFDEKIELVGQDPKSVDVFDDKFITNRLLKKNGISIPNSQILNRNNSIDNLEIPYPLIVKPLRGRGSQGVSLVRNTEELKNQLNEIFRSGKYGDAIYVEEFLTGQEITVTVMPPGKYQFGNRNEFKEHHWGLPVIKRFNHVNGVAPYSGSVAVIKNSEVLCDYELNDRIEKIIQECEKAARIVKARAPVRIDCRADENGEYYIFDLNMKPNMTGPSRPHRKGQDSLSAISARKIGWSYSDLLINMLNQKWNFADL